ncbi:unnamed protein product [Rotaria magnacalcarata]|uniref:Band 7 domain-containing protein n=2 Tax=Rotaria magnacalcarata TaxID=392030 RepID=A0A816M520_9BILA|nr:unnamed protein product [Rotaria magnacalcarata]
MTVDSRYPMFRYYDIYELIQLGNIQIVTVNQDEIGLSIRNGETILLDPVRELDELKVNTRDGVTITAKGLITYRIHDPRTSFMTVQDIHGAVKRAAEAILTSLFLNAAIDEIAPPVPQKLSDDLIQMKPVIEGENFNQHICDAFLHDFSQTSQPMGSVKDLLRKRAQARVETATSLANMRSQTSIAMQQVEREKQQAQIQAEAEAFVTRTKAVPLSAQLELKRLDVEIVKATGDRTTFMPMNLSIGDIGMADKQNRNMYFASNKTSLL